MFSVPEAQIGFIRSDKLVASVLRGHAAVAKLVVPEAVKLVALGVVSRVQVDCLGRHFDEGAWRYELAVGKGKSFEHMTREACWRSVCQSMKDGDDCASRTY